MENRAIVQTELLLYVISVLNEKPSYPEIKKVTISSKVARLLQFGFSSSKEVRDYQAKLRVKHESFENWIEKEKRYGAFIYTLKEARKYYNEALLIPYNQFERVIEKYDLVCGGFEQYEGELPDNIIDELDKSLYAIQNMSGLINAIIRKDDKLDRFPFITTDDPSFQKNMKNLCFICAPAKLMKRIPRIDTRDPFICAHTDAGILVFARWGEESNDEIIKMNEEIDAYLC